MGKSLSQNTLLPAHFWDKTLSTLLTTLDRDLLMQTTFNVTETIQDIHVWNSTIRSKRSPNPDTLAKIGRWRELDTVRALISKEVINQRPDGIVVDASLCRIHVIEVEWTEDSTEQLRHVFVRKNTKYIQLTQQLRALFPDFRTEQLTFVIGILRNDRWTSMTTETHDARSHRSSVKSSDTEIHERHNWRHLCSVASRVQATIVHPWCGSPLPWRQFKTSTISVCESSVFLPTSLYVLWLSVGARLFSKILLFIMNQ